ncbi:DNA repair protein REV1-like isoform X3 [Lytechinus variegatus]|uniref:DNA repair protein REV1-like isoform X3 n=1 Tax=Lytechinus variegatus TaxID=7654 RepID=UPI001BB26D61|nr:DNA repair protein REV1-like isoform X3 [Lytechinus variegatus]
MHSRGSSKNKNRSKSENENQSHGDYMSEKIRKLEEQFRSDAPTNKEKSGTSTAIFRGVTIHVNGYTDPSSDELKRLMTVHGGMYQHYYSVSRVTHIIATNLPYAKLRQLKNEKIVKPNWITDSIKAGRLLPSLPYELYTDRSSRQNQAVLTYFKGPKDKSGASNVPSTATKAAQDEEASDNVPQKQDTGSALSEADKSFDTPDTNTHGKGRSIGMATAGDSNFLSEFYNNSRLHHISTWGAECKAYVNELQRNGDATFPGKQRLLAILKEKRQGPAEKCELGAGGTQDDEEREWIEDSTVGTEGREGRTTRSNKKAAKKETTRRIMHIDMDCFFVSVGLIKRPDLVEKPVAVTHSKGQSGMSEYRQEISQFEREYYEKKYGSDASRQNHKEDQSNCSADSEGTGKAGGAVSSSSSKPKDTFHSMADIASCNYEARKAGVKNGMSMGRAKSLCPELQTIPYDFDGYKRVSQKLYDIVASYTHDIEAVSCDEMFVDISGILKETGASPDDFTRVLRQEIKDETQCNASAGIASSILLARMSTRVAKPNGQFILESHAVDDFIRTQPVKDLPGVGRSTTRKMEALDIKTCADLQQLSMGAIQKEFGQKTGQMLYGFCRGLDDRPIRQEQERKSVSAEVNYGIRFKQEADSEKFITELAAEVHKRLTAIKMLARTITIKLKVRHPDAPKETSKFMGHGICEDKARSCTLGQATDDLQVLQRESKKLLKELQVPAVDMRGVGIQLSKLSSSTQAGSLPSKSIAAFMTKPKPADTAPDPDPQRVTDQSISPSEAASAAASTPSGSKSKVRTMLNFVSKRPADAEAVAEKADAAESPSKTPRKKRKSVLPPLPFMPGPAGPKSSHLSNNLALPSPSQIDMSVLQELPKDIQEQILESYKGQKPSHSARDASEPSTSSGITDSSRWDQGVIGSVPPHILEELIQDDPNQGMSSLGVVEALPSFSQIDPSCLEALPADLQEELRSAYRGKQATGQPEPEPEREVRKIETRSQNRSPAKPSPAKSPFKIRKRGRPKKGSPFGKANNPKRPRWQMDIQQMITRNQTPPKPSAGGQRQEAMSPSNSGPQPQRNEERNLKEDENRTEEDKVERSVEDSEVNLCGAVELWDVKVLLKEWIASTNDPVDEDIGFIVQYLRELILDRNLEMVDHVMRSLIRSVKRQGSGPWLEAVEVVVSRIQHTMGQIYNVRLKIAPS